MTNIDEFTYQAQLLMEMDIELNEHLDYDANDYYEVTLERFDEDLSDQEIAQVKHLIEEEYLRLFV